MITPVRLKILLLQARRADDPVLAEEHNSFVEKTGLQADQIIQHDLLSGPPRLTDLARYDALMVGGSGDFSVAKKDLAHFAEHLDFFREVVGRGRPMFASCFGFHLMVEAMGGHVVHDPESTEVGTYDLELTPDGSQDPLLGTLPPRFAAQMGRKDRAEKLPEGTPSLATSERNPHQAFCIPGQPIWATQFHPELDAATNRFRFQRYIKGYSQHMSAEEQKRRLEVFRESPESSRLLRRFLRLVFG